MRLAVPYYKPHDRNMRLVQEVCGALVSWALLSGTELYSLSAVPTRGARADPCRLHASSRDRLLAEKWDGPE